MHSVFISRFIARDRAWLDQDGWVTRIRIRGSGDSIKFLVAKEDFRFSLNIKKAI